VLPVSSGTGALHLSLLACGVGEGDEVIISDFAFVAAVSAITYVGAKPVLVDAQRDTWGIDPEKIEAAITTKTKVIMPVHMYGSICEMDKIQEIAKKHNLHLVEDACPAIGAEFKGVKAGTLGDIAAFSFQGAKITVTGEGGMLVTNNKELYDKAFYYNNHCRKEGDWFWFEEIGYKYKMANLLAALATAQIERVEELLQMKRQVFNWYRERLGDIEDLSMNVEKEGTRCGFWMSSVVLDKDFGLSRDEVTDRLRKALIDTRPFFPTLSEYPMFENRETPNAHHIAKNGINLPSGVLLREEEVDYVCRNLRSILKA